jgi:aminoglycoside phosphotransferase (APT) family kinase protein
VLTHYEPYASHFFRHDRTEFYMIDWENVDCGDPAHDISVIWQRAFRHPKWQKTLWHAFRRVTPYPRQFDELFKVEIILQGISNLDYFHRTTIPAERRLKRQAIAFYRRAIHLVLTGQFNKLVN